MPLHSFTLEVNMESVWLMLRYALGMILIMGLVFVLALLTPRIARLLGKWFPKMNKLPQEGQAPPSGGDEKADQEASGPAEYQVTGPYDAQYAQTDNKEGLDEASFLKQDGKKNQSELK